MSGELDVTWDMDRSLGGRVLAAGVPWGPKVVTNDSGGPGGQLVGLWGSALCWTTWETFFGHNGSLFGSVIDGGGELWWCCCSSRGCEGGFSAGKIQLFKRDDPQGDHLSHPT